MTDMFASRSARPMLIGRIAQPFDDPDSLFELKLDGERCLAYLDETGAALVNRRGFSLLPRLPELAAIHRQAKARCILDGELVTGLGSKRDFDDLKSRLMHQNRVKVELGARRAPVSFVAFDILYLDDAPVTTQPLWRRKELLAGAVEESAQLALARTVPTQGKAFYALATARGLEGVVGKRLQSLYVPGKRTNDWVKVKNLEEDDYVICGYIPAEHVAMLVLGQYNAKGRLVYKGRVTLGLNTAEFAAVRAVPRAESWPYAEAPPEAERATVWLQPALVCTVYFMRRLSGDSMRQPHFRALRPDKAPREAVEHAEHAS